MAPRFRSVSVRLAVAALLSLATGPGTATAHVGASGAHDHTLALAVLGLAVAVLAGSLAADHFSYLDRSTADVAVVGGGVGIVLSIALLWI